MKCVLFFLLTSIVHAVNSLDSHQLYQWLQDNDNRRSVAVAIAQAYQKGFKNQQIVMASVDPAEAQFYHALLLYTQHCCKCAKSSLQVKFLPVLMCNNTNDDLDEVRAEIERLREEAKVLKEEGLDQLGRGLLEAAGAGTTFAAGQEYVAIPTGYYATKDIVKGCQNYADGARKEDEANQLEEEFFPEKTKKQWWEFWK
jgi:hypothetical protein